MVKDDQYDYFSYFNNYRRERRKGLNGPFATHLTTSGVSFHPSNSDDFFVQVSNELACDYSPRVKLIPSLPTPNTSSVPTIFSNLGDDNGNVNRGSDNSSYYEEAAPARKNEQDENDNDSTECRVPVSGYYTNYIGKKNEPVRTCDYSNESFFETSSHYSDEAVEIDKPKPSSSEHSNGINSIVFCETVRVLPDREKVGLKYLQKTGEVVFVENPYLKPPNAKKVVNDPHPKKIVVVEEEKSNTKTKYNKKFVIKLRKFFKRYGKRKGNPKEEHSEQLIEPAIEVGVQVEGPRIERKDQSLSKENKRFQDVVKKLSNVTDSTHDEKGDNEKTAIKTKWTRFKNKLRTQIKRNNTTLKIFHGSEGSIRVTLPDNKTNKSHGSEVTIKEQSQNNDFEIVNDAPPVNRGRVQNKKIISEDTSMLKKGTRFKNKLKSFFHKPSNTQGNMDLPNNYSNQAQHDKPSSEERNKNNNIEPINDKLERNTKGFPNDKSNVQEFIEDKHTKDVNDPPIINTSQIQDEKVIIGDTSKPKRRTRFKKKLKSFFTKT